MLSVYFPPTMLIWLGFIETGVLREQCSKNNKEHHSSINRLQRYQHSISYGKGVSNP